MGTAKWVVYGSSDRFANAPLVPDVCSANAPPEINVERVAL